MSFAPITWHIFTDRFKKQFISECVRDLKAFEFSNLVQGDMIMVQYDTKFHELAP